MKKIFVLGLFVLIFLVGIVSAYVFNSSIDNELTEWYPFNETSGTTLNDWVGIARDGVGANIEEADWLGDRIRLDGVNEYFNISDYTYGPIEFTIHAVIDVDTLGNIQYIWGSQTPATYNGFWIGYQNDNTGWCRYGKGSSPWYEVKTTSAISPTGEHTLTCTKNTTGLYIYYDGVYNNSNTTTSGNIADPARPIYLGSSGSGGFWNGTIGRVAIWNRSLNPAEVEFVWNRTTSPPIIPEISVNLITPTNDSLSNDDPVQFNATITPATYNLTNATIYVWRDNGTLFNSTTNSMSGDTADNTSWDIYNFNIDDYVWNVYGCQGNGNGINCSFADDNYTLAWVPFEVDGEGYNIATLETKDETIYINITTDATVSNMGAFLVYNGSLYAADHSCSGGFCQINRELDIPLLINQANDNENKSFYWQITLFGTFGTFTANTTIHQQNVSNIDFNHTTLAHQAVDYKTYNESNITQILADFDASFNYYLGTGTVSESKNYSLTGDDNFTFYINRNETFIVNATIKIENNTNIRNYFFLKEEFTNTSTTQELFVPWTDASNIIIEVKDQGLVPLEAYLTRIYRFYPSINQYKMVGSQLTDEFGQFVEKLVQNDAKYKFEFYNQNKELLKESERITIACRSAYCIVPFVIEIADSDFERFENLTLFSYDFSFDNTTNIFTLVWDDQREENSRIRLEVVRYKFNQSELVCNSTSTAKVSTLTCSVGSERATYKAQVFRSVNGNERRIALINVGVGSIFSNFGLEGLFWVFILLFTGIGIGAFNPVVGATIYGAGFLIFGVIGLISVPLPVFFANTLLVVLFIWAVKT